MNRPPDDLLDGAAAASQLTQLLECQAALLAHPALADAATALAAAVQRIFGCDDVAVAMLTRRGELRISGHARPVELDRRHPAGEQIVAAMHEALDQAQPLSWPASSLEGGPIVQAQRQYAGDGACCSVPLFEAQTPLGAITLHRNSAPFSGAELETLQDIAALAAPILALKMALERSWWERTVLALGRFRRLALARPVAAGMVAATALAMFLPVPWKISAPARLEGSVQRAVVAASDGYLQQANVRPGDRVREGQVLAQLASEDLELERRRRESELRQHDTAYRTAQARYDRPLMISSQARAAEAQALLSLAEVNLQRARVVAPFDGIVIKGDLTQNLGAPVQRGEVLMVVAPDASHRLILEVDEAEIAFVVPGQRGELALASQPEAPLAFTLTRVVPVATAADGRNFFEVEGRLDAGSAALRPGLSGVAKVSAGERPVWKLLTWRAWQWLRFSWWVLAG